MLKKNWGLTSPGLQVFGNCLKSRYSNPTEFKSQSVDLGNLYFLFLFNSSQVVLMKKQFRNLWMRKYPIFFYLKSFLNQSTNVWLLCIRKGLLCVCCVSWPLRWVLSVKWKQHGGRRPCHCEAYVLVETHKWCSLSFCLLKNGASVSKSQPKRI